MRPIFTLFCLAMSTFGQPSDPIKSLPQNHHGQITLTVLYDNTAAIESCIAHWGFSCLIQGLEKTILFDVGGKADVLTHNLQTLAVDKNAIHTLAISHLHNDHVGGLSAITDARKLKTVYLPEEPEEGLAGILSRTAWTVQTATAPIKICEQADLTGRMGVNIIEQSLIVQTPSGYCLITGCAHPGIVEIVTQAKKQMHADMASVLGGFHLLQHSEQEVAAIIDSLKSSGVRRCGATHCTGEKAIAAFRKSFGENFIELGAGRKIILE